MQRESDMSDLHSGNGSLFINRRASVVVSIITNTLYYTYFTIINYTLLKNQQASIHKLLPFSSNFILHLKKYLKIM